jgi:hypothetical protein
MTSGVAVIGIRALPRGGGFFDRLKTAKHPGAYARFPQATSTIKVHTVDPASVVLTHRHVSGIFAFGNRAKVLDPVVAAYTVDVVYVDRLNAVNHFEDKAVRQKAMASGASEINADISVTDAGTGRLSGKLRRKYPAAVQAREMVRRARFPCEYAGFWVVVEAFVQIRLRWGRLWFGHEQSPLRLASGGSCAINTATAAHYIIH